MQTKRQFDFKNREEGILASLRKTMEARVGSSEYCKILKLHHEPIHTTPPVSSVARFPTAMSSATVPQSLDRTAVGDDGI